MKLFVLACVTAMYWAWSSLWALCAENRTQQPRDAAQKVGEGDTARWLEYYRRERGHNWSQTPPSGKHDDTAGASQPAPKPAPEHPLQPGDQR